MINFEQLPKDKPNNNDVAEGRYTATVFKTQMLVSKTTSNVYLNVSFKLDKGGFVNENYFDSDKPFLLYKLGRLLNACNVDLKGEGSLKDIAKVIVGKKVIIDVVVNDNGYGSLDYSGGNEGIYSPNEIVTEEKTDEELDEDINQAIESDLNVDPYEDF